MLREEDVSCDSSAAGTREVHYSVDASWTAQLDADARDINSAFSDSFTASDKRKQL